MTLAGTLTLFVFLPNVVCKMVVTSVVPLRVSACPSFLFFFFFFFFPSSILLHAALLSFSLFGFVRFTSVLRIISFVYCLPMLSSSCSVLPFLPVFLVSGCLAFQFRCVLRLLVSAFHVPFLLCSASGAVSFCITFP